MSDTLTPSAPIVRTIDATTPRFDLPVSITEIAVAAGGCVLMALLGSGFGAWLMLPFGATG